MQIDGQIAVVTGGASGLGEATARYLAAKGCYIPPRICAWPSQCFYSP